jgi:uncharacterized protein YxjI
MADAQNSPLFTADKVMLRRKILTIAGMKFHFYDESQNIIGFSALKAFRLKEEITVWTDETRGEELFQIRARHVIDFAATYDIYDGAGQWLGALRRRGMKSFLRDEWAFLDEHDNELGKIQEDNMAMAMVRRFLISLIPQTFSTDVGGRSPVKYRQRFNIFVQKLDIEFSPDAGAVVDRRVALAAGLLLTAIEGRQN